jgi:tetratricopeptide (TPR) repeat protein
MPAIGSRTTRRVKKALPYLLFFSFVLMVVSAYSNTLLSPAFFDDFHSFVDVKEFYPQSISISSLLGIAGTQFGWTRFLPDVTFALNNSLGHSKLFYFHATNILIHILMFLAVLWLLREALAAEKKQRPLVHLPYELAGFFPLCVAALWALSPVQTSAVTYLVQRMASMQALFFTLSSVCFMRARLLSERKKRAAVVFYVLCALCALCAGLSKENSAMLPVVLAVIDIWFFDSSWLKRTWSACRRTSWKLRASAAAVFLSSSYYAFFVILPKLLVQYSFRDFTLGQRLMTEARVVVWYMSLLLWPVPSRLAMEHDPRISTSLFSPFTTLLAILFIAGLIFGAVKFRKRFPVITFGIVWFFLNLVIESTIFPLELVFEHRLYLPSVGFYMAVAAIFTILLRKMAKRLPEAEFAKAACSILLLAISFFCTSTFLRNGVWKDYTSIRYDTAEKAPESPRANADYANALCGVGQDEEALKYGEKAIRLGKKGRESYALAENAVIIALVHQGKADEAIRNATAFIDNKVNTDINGDPLPVFCLNVARACLNVEKPQEAYKWTLKALKYVQITDPGSSYKKGLVQQMLLMLFTQFSPDKVDPHLANALEFSGPGMSSASWQPKTACFLPAGQADQPGGVGQGACGSALCASRQAAWPRPEVLAAMVFKAHGEEQYARNIFERESTNHPDDPHVKAQMEKFHKEDSQNLAQKKNWDVMTKYVRSPFSRFNFDMAVAYLVQIHHLPKFFQPIGKNRVDAALTIRPTSRDALVLHAWYLYNNGDAGQAARDAQKLLAANPGDSNVWLASGFFLAKTGDSKGALAAFKKVLELYPGYPHRSIVEELCNQLSMGKNIESKTASK